MVDKIKGRGSRIIHGRRKEESSQGKNVAIKVVRL